MFLPRLYFQDHNSPFKREERGRETRESLCWSALTREFPEEYASKVWIIFFPFILKFLNGLK